MEDRAIKLGIIGVILAVIGLIGFFVLMDVARIGGSQIGVKETMSGVEEEPYQPGTYFFPGLTQEMYLYDTASQVFVMNDVEDDAGSGRDADSYLVQSSEGQDMKISLSVRYRLDPAKVILIHKTVRDSWEEKIIRNEVQRVVKDEATRRTAFGCYAGEGLVELQTNIEGKLRDPQGELATRGVTVENFVIEGVALDPDYVGQIKARQVAQQQALRAKEEQIAAEAEALKAKAEAQADLNRSVVAAERDKQVAVLKAEQESAAVVLQAEGAKQQQVLAAQAEQESSLLRAEAIKAIGQAEAEAQKLALSAYAVDGADAFVQIEVAKSLAEAFKNIDGYIPESMNVNVLSGGFLEAVKSVVGPKPAPAATQPQK